MCLATDNTNYLAVLFLRLWRPAPIIPSSYSYKNEKLKGEVELPDNPAFAGYDKMCASSQLI